MVTVKTSNIKQKKKTQNISFLPLPIPTLLEEKVETKKQSVCCQQITEFLPALGTLKLMLNF